MYYLKYNDIDLTQLVKVREVSLPSLPEIDHDGIDMWEMDGNIFSSLSYGNREVELSAIIQPLNPDELEVYVNDVKRAFFVREPRPLYLGDETKYLLAVPEGEVVVTELGKGTCELHVTLVAYYPYWIAKEVQNTFYDGKEGAVVNNGDVPTTPVITIGIGGDTTFVQLEKKNTKERILIGELPRTQKVTVKANQDVLFDKCQTTSSWVQASVALDSGCGTGGTLAVTSTGGGLCLGSPGGGNATWKGASYRRNLNAAIKNFRVRANFSFNSTGKNGDPSIIDKVMYEDDIGTVTGGGSSSSYKVKVNTALNVRSGPGTNYSCIGTYKNGHVITNGTVENGWLRHVYNGKNAYCSMQYITTLANDSRWTATVCNFVVKNSTALRTNPDIWSTAKATIPAGTVVRCLIDEKGDDVKFRQLYYLYNGNWGYVKSEDLIRASEMEVATYEVEGTRADDKEGIIQLYGYSSSGVQLFSLSVMDDSAWYEATYPLIKKNGQDFLYDQKFNEPNPKTRKVVENDTVKYEEILSGALGGWNEFEGDLYIERINDVWFAYINKCNGKYMKSNWIHDTANSSEDLAYVVIYVGVADEEKMSCMSINEIQIQNAIDVMPTQQNIQRFSSGDILEIDCGVPCVRLNGVERNDLVDIGSQFFNLEVGKNDILIASDSDINFGVLFNEKFL